ncbi:flocculation protein FLO11-like isoform X1 [Brassica napus]|uniref:flocculation protein FLO11-like isoform X1 n=1 Tax=Brassica napus TaxID=3708 RepID=UPI0020790F0F|nr:flocculation protein FLO11-like isoform X1 [Brassica napus]XP_048631838.1 flocculation protein FLO11-like isoform X1 [Brassica napus]XP_048631840.1 flocculation protein FLO11-like isoform X1 [Brassica napus]
MPMTGPSLPTASLSSPPVVPSLPMVDPSLPPDVPSLLMPAPSSSTAVSSSFPVALNPLMVAPSLPLDVPSSSTANLSMPMTGPSLPTASLSSPPVVSSLSMVDPSLPTASLSSPPVVPSLPMVGLSLPTAHLSLLMATPSSSTVVSSSSPVVTSGSLLVKDCGRDAEGTSLPLVGSSSAFVLSSPVPSSFLGSSLSLNVPSLPLSMKPCHGEVGLSSSSFGSSSSLVPNLSSVVSSMPSGGKVACEQLSLLVRKMELADGRKSWSEIAESVIAVELSTLTGSEAEDRVSASLIEEGTGFLFDEHGTNLAVEPGVEGSGLVLTTPLIVPSSSSLTKKTMLETIQEHEQMRLANFSQTKESSSETTSSSDDDSSYSSSRSEKSVDSAGVAGEYDDVSEDDKRDDDVESVGVEDDGDFSGECDDSSDEQDSFSGEQSGVSGSLGVIVGDGLSTSPLRAKPKIRLGPLSNN